MPGKISDNFEIFSLLGKVINVEFFSFLPQKMGTLKNPDA
jgi:hypothetical protein